MNSPANAPAPGSKYLQRHTQPAPLGYLTWLVVTWVLFALCRSLRKRIDRDANEGSRPRLPRPWLRLRRAAAAAGFTLTPAVFDRARAIFVKLYAGGAASPAKLTREYGKEEFLLPLDQHGQPVRLPADVLARWRETYAAHPAFAAWFREDRLPDGGPVLLAARWLCHLIGLLHGTVEIFIDLPGRPGETLVQVRGMGKFEAPGAFDIPCAGHISGVEAAESELVKELGEELNLNLDDFTNLRLIYQYNSLNPYNETGTINNEHRVLYRAELKESSARRIHFSDGEVAGLGAINTTELRALIRRYPERVASGLSGAIGFYE